MVSPTPTNSTKNNDNKILSVSDLCRICMLPGDYFKNSSHDITIRICKMLKTSTQIDVGINDGYSQIMCNNCYKQLYESYKFVLLAKSTQKELRKNPPFSETIKEKKPQIIKENSPSNYEENINTLSPIKENIDTNLNSITNNDIAKIKNNNIEKLTIKENQNQNTVVNKRLVLRSNIKKEEVIIVENNNSIDLTNTPVEENLPSLLDNEKKPQFIEPKPVEQLPIEKKLRRNERKCSKTKENETTEEPIELKQEEKSPFDKKRHNNNTVEIKEQSPTEKIETLPIDKKRRTERKGSKTKENDTDEIIELKEETPILKKLRSNAVDVANSTPKAQINDKKQLLTADNKKSIKTEVKIDPVEIEIVPTTSTNDITDKKQNEKNVTQVEIKRRFSDRVASKIKENTIKIDLTLSEEPENVPMDIDSMGNVPEKEKPSEKVLEKTLKEKIMDKSPKEKLPEKSPKEKILEKSPKEKVLEKSPKEKVPEKSPKEKVPVKTLKEKVLEKSPKEKVPEKSPKEKVPAKSMKEKVPEKSPKVKVSEKSPKEKVQEKTTKEKVQQKSPKEKVPEKSPKEKVPEKSPKEKVLEKSPKEKIPEKSPKEKEPQQIPEKSSNVKFPTPKEKAPEKTQKVPKPPKEKSSKEKLPKLIDDDTIIKKVENDPAVIKFLKQNSKENEKILKENTFENLSKTTSKKLSPTKLLIVKNKRRSKNDEKSKLVQTSIASYYMSPPDKQIKKELLSPIEITPILSPKIPEKKRSPVSILCTRSQLSDKKTPNTEINSAQKKVDPLKIQKIDEKLFSNEITLFSKTNRTPKNISIMSPKLLKNKKVPKFKPEETIPMNFLGEISLLAERNENNDIVEVSGETQNQNDPYVVLETLNNLKRKRDEKISPQKKQKLNIQMTPKSKKLITKKIVVSHKKNSDGKFKKKVKKTFIKINTKYLTRTIKGIKDSKKRSLRPKEVKSEVKSEPVSPTLDDILDAVGLVRKSNEGGKNKHECKICNLKFYWTESYRRHLASKHKLMPYQCRFCNEKFPSAIKLRRHKKEVHDAQNKPYKCIQCGENFSTFDNHLEHVQEVHNNKPKVICKICKAEFEDESKLNEHLDWHEKIKKETEMIEKKIKESLPKIVRSENRKFQCEHCSKQFRKSSDLVRHNRVHTGEKPFPCSLCNQKFQQRPNLQKHIISVHAEKKSFTCDICFKTFGRHDSKIRHMLTHSIEKPFTCSECNKSFVRECQLDTHFKRLHSNCKRINLEDTIKAETEI